MCMKKMVLFGLLLILASAARAEDTAEPGGVADDIPPPPQVEAEELEPEVTIIEKEQETLYEYRINGAVYMIKIQPKRGPAYYLLDLDGDGEMDTQHDDPAAIVVPHWVFLRW